LILHEAWLEYCAFFFVKIKPEDFKLTAENPKLEFEKFKLSNVFTNNKENIEEYYAVGEENLASFFENFESQS
jgi:hypothetical protein